MIPRDLPAITKVDDYKEEVKRENSFMKDGMKMVQEIEALQKKELPLFLR